MSAASKTARKARPAPGKAPAKPGIVQMNIKLQADQKAFLVTKAKANGRPLTAEAIYRLFPEQRMKADLAAGRLPVVDSPINVPAAPAATSAPLKVATQVVADIAPTPTEVLDLLHDLRAACLEQDTDTCIPSSLARRLNGLLAMFPRAAA